MKESTHLSLIVSTYYQDSGTERFQGLQLMDSIPSKYLCMAFLVPASQKCSTDALVLLSLRPLKA